MSSSHQWWSESIKQSLALSHRSNRKAIGVSREYRSVVDRLERLEESERLRIYWNIEEMMCK